jgi:hypothetical protein
MWNIDLNHQAFMFILELIEQNATVQCHIISSRGQLFTKYGQIKLFYIFSYLMCYCSKMAIKLFQTNCDLKTVEQKQISGPHFLEKFSFPVLRFTSLFHKQLFLFATNQISSNGTWGQLDIDQNVDNKFQLIIWKLILILKH